MQTAKLLMRTDNKDNDQRRDVYEPDFIPYACHYNPHTLLTKNGELLQTIKIVGFSNESVNQKRLRLRDAVREALAGSLNNDDYAVWFHTIRRRQNLTPGGTPPEGFAAFVNESWNRLHAWDKKFTNELYITIVRDGQSVEIAKPQQFLRALWPPAHRKYREDFLTRACHELEGTVQKMLKTLEGFGAHRLSIIEQDGHIHSEMVEFLGKIINLGETRLAIPVVDLSEYLPSKDVAFGYNIMEVRGQSGRHFGAILSIKEYKELSAHALDSFLQLPQEFIISQCVDFVDAAKVRSQYAYQKHITDLSGDEDLARLSGLNDIFNSNRGRTTDYGMHQLSVLLFEDSIADLERSVSNAVNTLSRIGVVAMREDIRLEETYWSLLPGNFEFICRRTPINIGRIGGFTSLHNFPAGSFQENRWGPAVTLLYTAMGTPYFFNFHHGSNGHTAIIGPAGAGKTVLVNFLCAEAQKFNGRLFFFDKDRNSEIFLRALGGNYHRFSPGSGVTMNPLLLPYTDQNFHFLVEWLWSLTIAHGMELSEDELTALQHVLHSLMQKPAGERRLEKLAQTLNQFGHPALAEQLAPWYGSGALAHIFDHAQENLVMDGTVTGFEMGDIIARGAPLVPAMLYLLYRVSERLDGTPSIVVLDEAWKMLNNDILAPKVGPWLELLEQNNAVAILATESVGHAEQSQISADIMDHIATAIFLPNDQAGPAYQDVFRLNEREFRMLNRMLPERHHFLLKHGPDAIVAELNFAPLPAVLDVLSGSPQKLHIFEQTVSQLGPNPDDWLEAYLRICAQERPRW